MKFNKYNVTNGAIKVRVHYNLDNRLDSRKCVTIYAKDYGNDLHKLFPNDYKNDTDSRTDYFEEGKVNLFEDHPHYESARKKVESFRK